MRRAVLSFPGPQLSNCENQVSGKVRSSLRSSQISGQVKSPVKSSLRSGNVSVQVESSLGSGKVSVQVKSLVRSILGSNLELYTYLKASRQANQVNSVEHYNHPNY